MDYKREQLLYVLQTAGDLVKELQADIQSDSAFRAKLNKSALTIQRRLQAPGDRAWGRLFEMAEPLMLF